MSIKRIIKSRVFKRFYCHLTRLSDSRQQAKVKHIQAHIILIVILAMFAGFNKFKEFHAFGIKYERKLRKILGSNFNMCSHDTLERAIHRIKSEELNELLVNFIMRFINPNERLHICIDGKVVRATRRGDSKHNATNIVTLYIAGLKLSLYSLSISSEDKTNEIPIIPKLLDMLHRKFPNLKVVITIDAIGANNTVLSKIKDYQYDFIICIKNEKRGLCGDIIYEFQCNSNLEFINTFDKGNGRYERRKYFLINNITNIPDIGNWYGVQKVGKMYSSVENVITGKVEKTERYFLLSDLTLQDFAYYKREHWQIENNLHYVLDNSFKEDRCRMKKGSSTLNLNLLRKFVINIISIQRTTNVSFLSITEFRGRNIFLSPAQLLYNILHPNNRLFS